MMDCDGLWGIGNRATKRRLAAQWALFLGCGPATYHAVQGAHIQRFASRRGEVDVKNFYNLALDHQGITFKPNDKKNTTAKSFVLEIENVKAAPLRKRDAARIVRDALAPSRCYGPLDTSSGIPAAIPVL